MTEEQFKLAERLQYRIKQLKQLDAALPECYLTLHDKSNNMEFYVEKEFGLEYISLIKTELKAALHLKLVERIDMLTNEFLNL